MAESPRLEELRRRVQSDPASIAFAALAEEYRRSGQLDEAVATARAGLARHPGYPSARVSLGRALLELGKIDEARTELEGALVSAPENLAALRALAELHREAGSSSRALELARRGSALAPQDREFRTLVAALEVTTAAPPQREATVIPFEPPVATAAASPPADGVRATEAVPPAETAAPALAALEHWLDSLARERLRREARAD
jgi:tetratricopeptide (TPR) repeat protein